MTFSFTGQIQGGKNNMVGTRTGHRFPKASWAKWRDSAVAQIRLQIPNGWKPVDSPTNVKLYYRAGDKRRRDMPAIIDAIWHVLEKVGVCTDDTHLWVSESTRHYSKENPGALVEFPDQ